MQMIDVIKKLREIQDKSPDVTRALENAEKLSVKQVDEGVQITVTGSDAVLSQILKLAGMIGAETHEASEAPVEAENRPYTNSPDEVTADIDAAVPAGSDLHGAKTTSPKVAGGDNPMQPPMSLRAALGM